MLWILLGVCGCVSFPPMPQNPDEFKEGVSTIKKGHVSSIEVNRSYEQVTSDLQKHAESCFNFTSTWTRVSGGVTRGGYKLDYNAKFIPVSTTRSRFTIQEVYRGTRIGPKMPEGGFYKVLAEMEKVSSTKTKVSFYSFGWLETVDVLKDWAEGGNTACPVN